MTNERTDTVFGTAIRACSIAGLFSLALVSDPSALRAEELMEEAKGYFEPIPSVVPAV
jgi:hypothetical protein